MTVFDTRVKFYHLSIPQALNEDGLLLSYPSASRELLNNDRLIANPLNALQQLILEHFSGYFQLFNKRVFLASSYSELKQGFEGTFQNQEKRSLLTTLLKIVSYVSLIIPLFVWIGLKHAQISLVELPHPPSPENKGGLFQTPPLATRTPQQQRIDSERELLADRASLLRARIGGEITLNDHRVWLSYKKHPTLENTATLQITSLDLNLDRTLQRMAKVVLEIKEDGLHFRDLCLNSKNPYLLASGAPYEGPSFHNFDEAPDSLQNALIPIARCLFYGAVRWWVSKNDLSDEKSPFDSTTPSAMTSVIFSQGFDEAVQLLDPSSKPVLSSTPNLGPVASTPHWSALPSAVSGSPSFKLILAATSSPPSKVAMSRPSLPAIIIKGNWSRLLRQDGPQRVVGEQYKASSLPLSLRIDPHSYKQAAFHAMTSPTASRKNPQRQESVFSEMASNGTVPIPMSRNLSQLVIDS